MKPNLYKLQLTNDFFVEFNQIARLLGAVCQQNNQRRLALTDLAEAIGVTQNRAESLGSIAVGMRLLRKVVLTSTPLGKAIHQYDPYLSDLGTLWMLHYNLSSNPRHVVWNRLINRVIPENTRFSTLIARPYFEDLSQHYSERSIREHLGGEMASFWNAYLEQDFSHLNLFETESEQIFHKNSDPMTVPALVFYTAVLLYRQEFAPRSATLDVLTLINAENGPGRVFFLRERVVRDLLDQTQRAGYINVETRADLDQIRFHPGSTTESVMSRYYQER